MHFLELVIQNSTKYFQHAEQFFGVADVYLRRLQYVQNAAARLVSGAHRHDHITPVLVGLMDCTGFQCASESSTRRRCLCGSVYMMQPLTIWLTCVCRPTPCMVASNCVPRRCYRSMQLRHQWTTNMEQSASRS